MEGPTSWTLTDTQFAELLSHYKPALSYTNAELAEMLHTYEDRINEWRQLGAIHGTLIGKQYIYSAKEVDRFLDDYASMNLSNAQHTRVSVGLVNATKKKSA